MPLRHACFVSYRHGQHALKRRFVESFHEGLAGELELLRNEGVFVDYDRLKPGEFFNQRLRYALYESVCMVLIYQPNYFDLGHPYCAREYRAMLSLERHRTGNKSAGDASSLIIPVVLRGFESLPAEIKSSRQCEDFSGFLLHEEDLSRHPGYARRLKDMAKYIHEQCFKYERTPSLFDKVESFDFPSVNETISWMKKSIPIAPVLPGRD